MWRIFGILFAVALHGGFILFGGLIVGTGKEGPGNVQEVELLAAETLQEEEEEKPALEKTEELVTESEPVPDAAEIIRNLEQSAVDDAPALEAASLSAIELALKGQAGGGGDFADMLSFASGGRIGGKGVAGALDEQLESAFSLAEVDQEPRVIHQTPPLFPAERRGKDVEGLVEVIFVVDSSGKVTNARVRKSSHPAFEKPALDALRRWKFEAAIRDGQRVDHRMQIGIRFQGN